MAVTYAQAKRQMNVTTPLGPDALLLVGFTGHEQVSGLFSFTLDLLAENSRKVDFSTLLGQEIGVTMLIDAGTAQATASKERYFRGVCRRVSEGDKDQTFTSYQVEIVPPFWLTTRIAQSRIFQHISVPDILKKVLSGIKVTWDLKGKYEKRNYCVQYRETDFNFCSRLMEEEGLYYFFKHNKDSLEMVVADSPTTHPDVPGAVKVKTNIVAGSHRQARQIFQWQKSQDIRSGKVTLWDYTFEQPGNNLEAKKPTMGTVMIGTVNHKLQAGGNDKFEIYDYPGEYAQRFDGIDKGGGEQAAEIQKIFQDNQRTAALRMEAETLAGVVIRGESNCNQFSSGYKFEMEGHPNADGKYVLTSVRHSARSGTSYRSGDTEDFVYLNDFTCIPAALPFRPQRVTPKPSISGVQTAIVVGPSGEEIFTDKYGRVKVQFHWDRESTADANSSCWLRVGTPWAGKQWGSIHIPRIGQEVIVQFLEGDPDAPIIVGSVYNAGSMPPYKLPDEKTKSTLKSNSSRGGGGFNEIRFEDKKGSEQIYIHAEKDREVDIKNDSIEKVGHDNIEKVVNDQHLIVQNDRYREVTGDEHITIGGSRNEEVGESLGLKTGSDIQMKSGKNVGMESAMEVHIKAGMTAIIEAGAQLSLKAGGSFVDISAAGVSISGTLVLINSGGAAGSGSGCNPTKPTKPTDKDPCQVEAGQTEQAPTGRNYSAEAVQSPTALALMEAAATGDAFCPVG